MGYFLRVATPPAPFKDDECGFTVVMNGKAYVRGEQGRLYEWDGVATEMTLVADAPGAGSGMTDLAVLSGQVFGAGLDGHLWRWNGARPSTSKGGTGQWLNAGSIAFPLYSAGEYAGRLYAGSAFEGALYQWNGATTLTKVANPIAGQIELHFIKSIGNVLYTPTGYDALLTKYAGGVLVNLTPATVKFQGQEIIYSIDLGADGFIYGGTREAGMMLRWNGTNAWELACRVPVEWSGLKDLHFLMTVGDKIYAVVGDQHALISYNTRTNAMTVEVAPSVHVSRTQGLFLLNGNIYAVGNSVYQFVDTALAFSEVASQGDLRLHWDLDGMDLSVVDADLERDEGIETAITTSLFTNKRADITDQLPGSDSDPFQTREGWWADNDMGSKLWLLQRSKTLPEVVSLAEQYGREALAWMIEDGVASAVEVVATRYDIQTLLLSISVSRPAGIPVYFRYYYNWQNQLFRRV